MSLPPPAERRRLLSGLSQPPPEAARFLLGQVLVRLSGRRRLAARIVETEAYLGADDPAAHAYPRPHRRARSRCGGRRGPLYVYFIYGMHHCLNLAVERGGRAGLRADPRGGAAARQRARRRRRAAGPAGSAARSASTRGSAGRHLFEPGDAL